MSFWDCSTAVATSASFRLKLPSIFLISEDTVFNSLRSFVNDFSSFLWDFKDALKNLPCCTTSKDGSQQDLPINVIIIADGNDLLRVLIRAGWSETATKKKSASSERALSSDFPQSYRYASVTPIYYYGRNQDASFRETGASSSERNLLRLWLSPIRYEEKEVWVGQVTRKSIDSSSSKKNQKINMDEVRSFLLQNLWYAQGVEKFGFVEGSGVNAPFSKPRTTFRGVTYATDGYRVVLWMSGNPVPLSEVGFTDWETPPQW